MPDVIVVSRKHQHHAAHSGYLLLGRYMGDRASVVDAEASRWMPLRLTRLVSRYTGPDMYTQESLRKELTAIWRLMRGRARVLHYLYGDRDIALGRHIPGRGKRLVCASFHKPPYLLHERFPGKHPLRGVDLAIGVGSNQLETLHELGVAAAEFVPHGVDADFWAPGEDAAWIPARAIAVGEHLRDLQMQARVAEQLRSIVPGFVLDVVVSRSRHAEIPQSEAVCCHAGLPDEQLREMYRRAAFHLIAMHDCTANNALLESMACGCPTVATDVGAIRDYTDKACAILCPPDDQAAMAEAALSLIRDEPTNATMRAAARQQSLTFDWPRVVMTVFALYEKHGRA